MWKCRIVGMADKDPLYHCIVVKESGCAHVDGYLCHFDTCDMRLNRELELFRIELARIGLGHSQKETSSDNTNKNNSLNNRDSE